MTLPLRIAVLWTCTLLASATAQPPPAPPPPPPPPISTAWTIPSLGQLERAAGALEIAVNLRDAKAVDDMVDSRALFRRAIDRFTDGNDALWRAEESVYETLSLGTVLTEGLGTTGDYTYLASVERDGEIRARFRQVGAGEEINYHDIAFLIDERGQTRVVDLYIFTSGEDMSRTLGRTLRSLLTPTGDATDGALEILAFIDAHHAGDYRRVFDMYPTLRITEDNRKMLALLYVLASSQLSTPEYQKALSHFASFYRSDPSLDLVLIDRYFLEGDFESLLETIDRLDAIVEDPYLDVYRATTYVGLEDLGAALDATTRLVEAFPTWDGSLTRRIDVALLLGRPDLVLKDLLTLERDFGWEFDDALIRKNMPGFASSPQFDQWRQRNDVK